MSLVGSHPTEHAPGAAHAALWLGICAGAAAALSATRVRCGAALLTDPRARMEQVDVPPDAGPARSRLRRRS